MWMSCPEQCPVCARPGFFVVPTRSDTRPHSKSSVFRTKLASRRRIAVGCWLVFLVIVIWFRSRDLIGALAFSIGGTWRPR